MEFMTEPERQTPVVADVDVLVCGGGFAGVAAAACAARNRAKVLLLERYGFLGGMCTAGLVITTPPLNNGINTEIAERLKKMAVYVPCQHSGEQTEWLSMRSMDPEFVKYELARMAQEVGVDLLLHTYIVGAITEGNVIKSVIMENKAGREAVRAKVVVDCTGDADVAAFSNAPFRLVRKPMTRMFNLVGVDIQRVLDNVGNWSNLKKVLKEGMDKGQVAFDLGVDPGFGAPGVHAEELVYQGQLNVWSGMLLGMNGVDPRDLTKAEIITREHVPGFERSRIEYTASQVGVRATRQIIGEASPAMDEVLKKKFDDTVVKPYAERTMRLPYGSILPQSVENLLVAGRCISAEEEAMGQLRLIPVCSATGQAAGTAAALALKQEVPPRHLDVSLLQKTLIGQGMDLALA